MDATMFSTGIASLDEVLGGLLPGDNVVWVAERNSLYELVERSFLRQSVADHPTLLVASNSAEMKRVLPSGVKRLDATSGSRLARPAPLADEIEGQLVSGRARCVVIDGLAGLGRRWGADKALGFFERACPTMLQTGALTYWRVSRSVGPAFLDRMRQVTQCVLELRGDQLHVTKAEGRPASLQGSVHHVHVDDDSVMLASSRSGGRLARGLAAVRRDLGLTQAQLADVAGVTASAISQAESGSRGLSVDTLITLSDRLEVTLDRLVGAQAGPGYHLARHDRPRNRNPEGAIALADDSTIGLRVYLMTLGGGEGGGPHLQHNGAELVAVVRGLLQVEAGADTPVLRSGDSLLATSATISGWRNLRREPASFYWVLRD
ncbi:MAG: helix-turn-helix domain-containing protein [Ilumatobacteraceae bacterium]